LGVATSEIAKLCAALKKQFELTHAVQEMRGFLEIDFATALAIFSSIDSLAGHLLDEKHREIRDGLRTDGIKREFSLLKQMRQKLIDSEKRDRLSRIRNPKMAMVALPEPNRQAYPIPKGILRPKPPPV
jgi:hypothetical protein